MARIAGGGTGRGDGGASKGSLRAARRRRGGLRVPPHGAGLVPDAGSAAGWLLLHVRAHPRFALTCSLEAFALAFPFALGDRLAVLAVFLRPLAGAGFLPLVLGWTLVTAIVVLPAAIVAGYQFPLLIALLGPGRSRVGREVGVTYAANTVGAIAGSIAGGFGLLLNTDDHPILEFGFARGLGRSGLFRVEDLAALARSRKDDRPPGLEIDWGLVGELRQARSLLCGDSISGKGRDPQAEERRLARAAYSDVDLKSACAHWFAQSAAPFTYPDLLLTSECLAAAGDPRAPEHARRLRPVDAELVLAIWDDQAGRDAEAVRHLVAAFEGARRDPWASIPLLDRVLTFSFDIAVRDPDAARVIFAALAEPFAVGMVDQARLRQRLELTWLLREGCVEALAPFEPYPPWEDLFLAQRARCYREAGHQLEGRALADLEEYMRNVPPRLDIGLPPPAP